MLSLMNLETLTWGNNDFKVGFWINTNGFKSRTRNGG
jgi:hypothetical protein